MAIVSKENYREYAASSYSIQNASSKSIQELVHDIEYHRNRLYCKNPDKWLHFAICIGMIEQVSELSELYTINEGAFLWEDRITRKSRTMEPPQISLRPLACYPDTLPICYDTSGQDFPGLYFMGATYFNPINMQPIYAVKIGMSSSNIGRRIQDYGTYNPFIYHERAHTLPFGVCETANERLCHAFLESVSIQKMDKTSEWYIVDKQTYLYLCENMKRITFFEGVATGKIRAI